MEVSLLNPIFNSYNVFLNKATLITGKVSNNEIEDINEFFSSPLNIILPSEFTFITLNELNENDLIFQLLQNFDEYHKIYKYTEFKVFCQEIISEIESFMEFDWIYEDNLNEQNIFYDFVFYRYCFLFPYDEKCYLSSMLFDKKNTYEYLFKVIDWINKLFIEDLKDVDLLITPFNEKNISDVFKFLDDKWVYRKELRYGYIYNFLIDTLNFKIDFTEYQRFILKKYNIRVYKENALSNKIISQLPALYKEFDQI